MILSPSDAERLARLLVFRLATFEWNRREGESFIRFDFRLESRDGDPRATYLPTEAGDPAQQVAQNPEGFVEWYEQHVITAYLPEAELVSWLLKEAPRFQEPDVRASLQSNAHVDFAVPFSYRYDWDGVLQVAGVLQTGPVLEFKAMLFLAETWRQIAALIAWSAEAQTYLVSMVGPESASEGPAFKAMQSCDIEMLGSFFKEHHNSYYAVDWIEFTRRHQSAASEEATARLRAQFAATLTAEDCETLLRHVRGGKELRLDLTVSDKEQTTLLWENRQYLKRHLYQGEVTDMGGQTLYEGQMGDTAVLTEAEAVQAIQKRIVYRHRMDLAMKPQVGCNL